MVFVNDKKYSCEACIKGHRSSSCKHTDRPLFEIKKKGRPVTQCEHCRELRKTKQVHVKCICQGKPAAPEEKGKKGRFLSHSLGSLKKVLASAAYPNGLPNSLEGVASHPPSEPSSDSDQSNRSHACDCKDDKDCHCYTLKHHPRRKAASSDPGPSSLALAPLSTRRGSTNLRPVLPKPPHTSTSANNDNPSVLAPRPHLPRSTHGSTFFSPYGRAYNEHLSADPSLHSASHAFDFASPADQPSALDQAASSVNQGLSSSFPSSSPLPDFTQWSSQNLAASSCACGDSCACPGCVEHRGASAWFTRECANPGVCTTCFTCLTSSRPAPPPAPTPPTTPLGARPSREFEQWMDIVTGVTPSFFPGFDILDVQAISPDGSQQQQQPAPMTIDILPVPAHCTGLCVPGQCSCMPDSAAECQRDSSPFFDAGLTSAMLPPIFDLDMDASTFSLPNTSPRGRSSSYHFDTEGDIESLRLALPKASSTTSLLPVFAPNGNNASLMSRVFPMRNAVEGSTNQTSQARSPTSGPGSQPSHRRGGSQQQHTSAAFFEAASRRFG